MEEVAAKAVADKDDDLLSRLIRSSLFLKR